jgi:hypothetical protein
LKRRTQFELLIAARAHTKDSFFDFIGELSNQYLEEEQMYTRDPASALYAVSSNLAMSDLHAFSDWYMRMPHRGIKKCEALTINRRAHRVRLAKVFSLEYLYDEDAEPSEDLLRTAAAHHDAGRDKYAEALYREFDEPLDTSA